jgi:hypothetical protein
MIQAKCPLHRYQLVEEVQTHPEELVSIQEGISYIDDFMLSIYFKNY